MMLRKLIGQNIMGIESCVLVNK